MNKKTAAIHDLSGVGRCSLTVIMPVLSVMGIEVCPVPTAILSTHTGGFGEVEMRDLTDYIIPALNHYKRLGMKFDCVYSGFLADPEQVDHCLEFFRAFPDSFKVVDPVMADNGKLYPAFDEAYAKENAKLCAKADLIVPNLTEASFLTGMPYQTKYDRQYILDMLEALAKLGPKYVALTGVSFEEGKIGVMGLDTETGEYFEYYTDHVPVSYHGTGDIFSSVVVGALTRGLRLKEAFRIACDYTKDTIAYTFRTKGANTYGVDFEVTLPELIKQMENGTDTDRSCL